MKHRACNRLSESPLPGTMEEYVASEEFQRDARELDAVLRPILKYASGVSGWGHFKEELNELVPAFAVDMVEAYIGQGGFGGDISVADANWDDPVYGLYRIHKSMQKGPYSLAKDGKFGVLLNNIRAAVQSTLDEVERLKKMPPDVNPPDAKDPIFGKYVFSPQRGRSVPNEMNTPDEQWAYDRLRAHVVDNEPMDSRAALILMQVLADKTYPDFFFEPKSEYVFRGLSLPWFRFARLIGEKDLPDDEKTHSKDVSIRIKAQTLGKGDDAQSTSWTSDWQTAREFSDNTNTDQVSVVMVARISDNPDTFLSGPDGYYKIPGLDRYDEKEALALGSVKVSKVFWRRGRMVGSVFDPTVKESKMGLKTLKALIREMVINEIDIEDVGEVCYTAGSTHVMKTCKIGGDKYFLKFSDEERFDEGYDPSLQILVEYLAYRIYGLYAGINIPTPELVYDRKKGKVGIATSAVPGKMALKVGTDPKFLAKMMSQGVYVDVFLSNWDVIGTGAGNVFVDKDKATRIDPGGSLTFRATGPRKGGAFNPKVRELETMLQGDKGAGVVFKYADLAVAAKEFLAVDWPSIESELDTVRNEVAEELEARGMEDLYAQWDADCDEIKGTLKKRHGVVRDHAMHVLKTR